MESKKLQQLQQANAHLGSQLLPQKKNPSTFHPNAGDYRSSHSPVFQSHLQYHAASSIPQSNLSLQHQSPSSASQSTSISTAPTSHLFSKSPQNLYHPQQINQYGSEQLYQTAQERMYQMASSRSHYPAISHNHPHPVNVVQQQYQQLQQAKIQQQIQTQNEALAHQQRTFALRQQLNPPIPQSHFHIQSQSFMSSQSLQSQAAQQPPINQAPQRTLPPSTLNLSSPCQPAQGPVKLNNIDIRAQHYHQDAQNQHLLQSQAMYQKNQELQQHQQLQSRSYQEKLETGTPSDHGPVYIQQNHPGHVMNQACQTQISGAIGKTKTPNDEQKGTSAHPPLDRKKSSGSIQALKSPLTKRPASSPVTLSGWLYKQGSDGLKVWRKRWFVLSEYCLYYYKGPEEEKVLGSILLPSYKVAACLPEDKIYRKYAFKCEHTNMRTYWLAAENAEQMCQWVRALTAATMMQASSESDQASQPSVSSLNQSGENSDSGIHTFQSQQSKLSMPQGPVTPASDCGGGGGAQPLYANAPPKPKRANDGGYSSPSPENSIDRCETNVESHRHVPSQQRQQANVHSPMSALQQQKSQHHAIYDTRTGSVTSAIRHPTNTDALAAQLHLMNMDRNVISGTYPQHKSSNHIQTGQIVGGAGYQHGVDLEDHIIRAPQRFNDDVGNEIYGERELYMQNHVQQKYPNHIISGVTYPNVDHRKSEVYRTKSGQSRMFSNYEDVYNTGQNRVSQNPEVVGAYRRPTSPPMYTNDKHVPPMPSRYAPSQLENNVQVNLRAKNLQPSGIMRPHSADFLEYEARAEAAGIKPDPIRTPRPKSSLDINRTPDSFYYSEASYAEKMRQSALYLQKPQNQLTNTFSGYKNQDLNPFLGGTNTISYDRSKRNEISQESLGQDASSIPRSSRHNSKDYRSQQSDQFLRSASARLPRKDEDTLKDGERKREESMKRLLEWKQRMLQSPLTRKGGQQNSPSVPVKVGNISNVLSHGIQRSRSETHANAGYNSYSSDDEASISVRNVRNIPKVNLTVKPEPTDSLAIDSINPTNQYNASVESKHIPTDRNYYSTEGADLHNTYDRDNFYPLRKSGSRAEIDLLERETSSQIRNLDMSAGDLLSRTHEELVLLLIQLRRQNSTTARAIEQCCTEIHDLQNRIRTSDGLSRSESIQRLNFLKQHLIDLEKQYEKSKPLVNLVDNMVKLGSLYRSNESSRHIQSESVTLDRLEFNQKIQERRLLQEEQKHWDRLSPNHTELQSKVRQLYQLDQLLQEESGTLQNLQRDKEDLERALGGLRARLQDSNGQHPLAMEAAKKQQHLLERELSRVHQLLAENSKKLEQTVAGNARLEQELLILRQKLQASRGSRGSQGALGGSQSAGDSIQYASNATALLESELRRVQQLVGDMQRQRQELSQAVRQLTENSNALYQQIGHKDNSFGMSSHIKKRHNSSCWTETDLDSMLSTDHTQSISMENLSASTPLYIDTASANSSGSILNCSSSSRMSGLDDRNMRNGRYSDGERNDGSGLDDELTDNAFANLSNTEKQEIKTVRIVKRESERRHRDRERSANAAMSIQNLDQVLEEDGYNQMSDESHSRSRSLPRTSNDSFEAFKQVPQQKASLINSNAAISSPTSLYRYDDYFANISNPYPVSMSDKNSNLSSYNNYPKKEKMNISNYIGANHEQLFMLKNKTESIQSLTSPVFQSEAARQIISEMSGSASEDNTEKVPLAHKHKRTVPKEKRRHYTAPNNVNTKAIQNMQAENDMNCNNTNWRARDDLDMEVALRPRINAPDVVRSALGHREKISENTIDKLLAAPSKILIPERYIPEKTPELSPEEKKRRQEKVEAIKKMLSEAPLNTANDTVSLPPSKINAEKKQREHLLQLNQILAQQVMQMSKIVAGNPSQSNQK